MRDQTDGRGGGLESELERQSFCADVAEHRYGKLLLDVRDRTEPAIERVSDVDGEEPEQEAQRCRQRGIAPGSR